MKILVTGSTGFVGSHIVDALEKHFSPCDIYLLVRDPQKVYDRRELGINIIEGDITVPDSLASVLKIEPDIFIHSAALANDWIPLSKLLEVNAQGTENLLNLLTKLSGSPFFVHISSSGVYRRQEAVYLTENSPIGPHGNYQKSKVVAEEILQTYIQKRQIRAVIIRPPNVMGIRDLTHMVKICKAIKERKFPIIRNGSARQTWVAAEDLAKAVIICLENQDIAVNQKYNLKSFELTVKGLYDQITALLDITDPPKIYPYRLAYFLGLIGEILGKIRRKPSTLNRYRVLKFSTDRLYNDDKIRSELGFVPQKGAQETIKNTVQWLQNEGKI
ncbi:MAG: NAD-dependent epimerase/dehydratase family protein [Candidatus Hodarchaeales archaeon]